MTALRAFAAVGCLFAGRAAPSRALGGAALGLACALAASRLPVVEESARPALALSLLVGVLGPTSLLVAIVSAATGVRRALRSGLLMTVLARPVPRGALVAGALAGEAGSAGILAASALIAGALISQLALPNGPAFGATRPVDLPLRVLEEAAASSRARLVLSGNGALVVELGPQAGVPGSALRIEPANVLVDGIPGEAEVSVVGPGGARAVRIPYRGAAEVPLGALLGSAPAASPQVRLVVTTPGAVLGFARSAGAGSVPVGLQVLGPPASRALSLGACLLGLVLVGVAGAALGLGAGLMLSEGAAVAVAAAVALLARFPAEAAELSQALVAPGARGAAPSPWDLFVGRLLEALVALLPDLGRLDLGAAVANGRLPGISEAGSAAVATAFVCAPVLLLGLAALHAREAARW